MINKKQQSILFSGPMIRAILGGYKTMTRRVVKPSKGNEILGWGGPATAMQGHKEYDEDGEAVIHASTVLCPYGESGESVWIKETWQHGNYPHGPYTEGCNVFYRADYLDDRHGPDGELSGVRYRKWRSSLLMPRVASRLSLMLEDIGVQRLLDISEEDAIDEGAVALPNGDWTMNPFDMDFQAHSARDAFLQYWDFLNDKRGLGTNVNPFVWTLRFPRVAQ